jgi:hypothetical protein
MSTLLHSAEVLYTTCGLPRHLLNSSQIEANLFTLAEGENTISQSHNLTITLSLFMLKMCLLLEIFANFRLLNIFVCSFVAMGIAQHHDAVCETTR